MTNEPLPVGIRCRWFVLELRRDEILAALARYSQSKAVPPIEWIRELEQVYTDLEEAREEERTAAPKWERPTRNNFARRPGDEDQSRRVLPSERGHYWAWWEGAWHIAEWDGEDWTIEGGTVFSYSIPYGPRLADKPEEPPA